MVDVPHMIVEAPLLKTGCVLGEGPIYDPKLQTLHFVDIGANKVYHYNTLSAELSFEEFGETVTALALRSNGEGLACIVASGFAIIDHTAPGKLLHLSQPLPQLQTSVTRFNDGACDAKGRFLAGTLQSKKPGFDYPGALYSYDPSNSSCKLLDDDGITDSNGLGWTNDNKTLYYTNSRKNHIYRYDYNLDTGSATNRSTFIDGEALGLRTDAFFDGLAIDTEGCIWSALWAGSKILRFNSSGTSVDFELQFPTVYSITACCFGGPNNDRLYITTARPPADADPSLMDKFPDSGHLFMVDFAGRYQGGQWRYDFAG